MRLGLRIRAQKWPFRTKSTRKFCAFILRPGLWVLWATKVRPPFNFIATTSVRENVFRFFAYWTFACLGLSTVSNNKKRPAQSEVENNKTSRERLQKGTLLFFYLLLAKLTTLLGIIAAWVKSVSGLWNFACGFSMVDLRGFWSHYRVVSKSISGHSFDFFVNCHCQHRFPTITL